MAKIKLISDQNLWWKFGSEFIHYDRHLLDLDKAFIKFTRKTLDLKPDNIYIIRGPRQVGKTSYLKILIRDLLKKYEHLNPLHILYLSLDQFSGRRELRESLDYFMSITKEQGPLYIFLDEITRLEGWSEELKRLYDLGFTKRAIIVATGSSPSQIKASSERMPGRGVEGNEYLLKPLCFREFVLQIVEKLSHKPSEYLPIKDAGAMENLSRMLKEIDITPDLQTEEVDIEPYLQVLDISSFAELAAFVPDELTYLFNIYLRCGGYPRVINDYLHNKFVEKKDNIDSKIAEFIVRDFMGDISSVGVRNEALVLNILEGIIKHYGRRYSFNELARNISGETEKQSSKGGYPATVKNYLNILEASFIAFINYFLDQSGKINADKQKKVYFFDPFLYHSLLSYRRGQTLWTVISENISDEEIISKIVEGVVVSHLRLWQEIPYSRESWSFLGFYYDRSSEIDAVTKIDSEQVGVEIKFRAQAKRIRRIPDHMKRLLVITKDETPKEDEKLLYLPACLFLALIAPSFKNL